MKNPTKKSRAALLAGCLLCLLPAAMAAAVDFQTLGLTVVSSGQEDGQTVLQLRDNAGARLTVTSARTLTDDQVNRVGYLYESLSGWGSMGAPAVRATVTGTRVEALVLPSRYIYNGLDLVRYLPSGMQFYLDNLLEYDFRMKVGSLFLRVKGQFYDEDQLSARITEAATDPVRFLERTDPEYLFRTFQETANVLQQLEGGATNAIDSLRELVVGYQALRDERPVVERRLNELTAERDRLSTELETLQAAHGDLQTRHEALKEQAEAEAQAEAAELERSRLGFLAVQNAGLFSGPRPMDPALVSRVLALKRANGAVTTEEILATLKGESISGNKKQVELIILAYFGPPAAGS